TINSAPAQPGQAVDDQDIVKLGGQILAQPAETQTILFNKPAGYIVSRNGQGSPTIYDLLPAEFHNLKPIGRLDKDSSGLLLLTNDGQLANKLTHPKFLKQKIYEIELNKPLAVSDQSKIEQGIILADGRSRLSLKGLGKTWTITMHEGRNRQIRRSFAALGYQTIKLHRTQFGNYYLSNLKSADHIII
ncbi:MAG: pseudouridine synthase, partial [Candidatus Saccharimonadales bacterium]